MEKLLALRERKRNFEEAFCCFRFKHFTSLSPTMPPKATTASTSTSTQPAVDVASHLQGASKNAKESEVGDGPEGNWEVAVSSASPF